MGKSTRPENPSEIPQPDKQPEITPDPPPAKPAEPDPSPEITPDIEPGDPTPGSVPQTVG